MADINKWVRAREAIMRHSMMESLGIGGDWSDLDAGKKPTIESMKVVDEDRARRISKLSAEDRAGLLASDVDLLRMAGWAGDNERFTRERGCADCGGPAHTLAYDCPEQSANARVQALRMGGPLPGAGKPSWEGPQARPRPSVPGFDDATRGPRELYHKTRATSKGAAAFQRQLAALNFTSDDAVQQPKAPPEKKKAPAAADPSRKTKAHAAMAARFAVEPRDEEPWCRAGGAWSWRGRPVGTRR